MILLNIPTLCRVTLSSSLPSKHLPRPIISLHLKTFQSHTLEDLAVFTQYLVSLRVFNPEGAGPDTIVVVMTDEGGEQHRDTHISDIFGPSGLAWTVLDNLGHPGLLGPFEIIWAIFRLLCPENLVFPPTFCYVFFGPLYMQVYLSRYSPIHSFGDVS